MTSHKLLPPRQQADRTLTPSTDLLVFKKGKQKHYALANSYIVNIKTGLANGKSSETNTSPNSTIKARNIVNQLDESRLPIKYRSNNRYRILGVHSLVRKRFFLGCAFTFSRVENTQWDFNRWRGDGNFYYRSTDPVITTITTSLTVSQTGIFYRQKKKKTKENLA